jgi:hypothetical protein
LFCTWDQHNTKAHTTTCHQNIQSTKGDHTSNFNPLKATANITERKMTATKNAVRKLLKKVKTMINILNEWYCKMLMEEDRNYQKIL